MNLSMFSTISYLNSDTLHNLCSYELRFSPKAAFIQIMFVISCERSLIENWRLLYYDFYSQRLSQDIFNHFFFGRKNIVHFRRSMWTDCQKYEHSSTSPGSTYHVILCNYIRPLTSYTLYID